MPARGSFRNDLGTQGDHNSLPNPLNFYSNRNTNRKLQDLPQQLHLVLKSLMRPTPHAKAFRLEHAAHLRRQSPFPYGCRLPHLQATKEREEGHGATIQAIDVFGQAEDRGGARPGGFVPRDSAHDLARRLHRVSRGEGEQDREGPSAEAGRLPRPQLVQASRRLRRGLRAQRGFLRGLRPHRLQGGYAPLTPSKPAAMCSRAHRGSATGAGRTATAATGRTGSSTPPGRPTGPPGRAGANPGAA